MSLQCLPRGEILSTFVALKRFYLQMYGADVLFQVPFCTEGLAAVPTRVGVCEEVRVGSGVFLLEYSLETLYCYWVLDIFSCNMERMHWCLLVIICPWWS